MKRLASYVVGIVVAAMPVVVQACPYCKDAVANTDAQTGGSLGAGFNWSIYLMLGALLAVMGMLSGVVAKGIRDTDRVGREHRDA